MLNSTILGLSTVLLTSSSFSISPFKETISYSIKNSLFSKSLHTLFYINIFSGTFKFTQTTFDHIINRAICVDSSYDFKDEVIENRYAPSILSANYYTFESCMFRNCHCAGEKMNGGAVSITVPSSQQFDIDLKFKFCSFYNCYAAGGQGGAFAGLRVGNVSFLGTCFSMCYTKESLSTQQTGMGTAVYIYNRESTKMTKSQFCSITDCPNEAMQLTNTETVFYISFGMIEIENSNFTGNYVNYGSSAFSLMETDMNNILYTSCVNCIGAYTISFCGVQNAKYKINAFNFINCSNKSQSGEVTAIITMLYCQMEIDDSVFIMNDNKNLVSRDKSDTTSIATFSKCVFNLPQSDLYDLNICTFIDCYFNHLDPKTKNISIFDSQQCWEIPSHSPNETETPFETSTKTIEPSETTFTFTNSPLPTDKDDDDESDSSHDNYKWILYICIANSILLVVIIIFLIVKCIVDARSNDHYSIAMNESLAKFS